MPNVWFTADTHFGHANIIKHCLRPFLSDAEEDLALEDPRGRWRISPETVAHHDRALLDAINSAVQPNDTLWIVGDFCWGRLDVAKQYRDAIQCRDVRLVWGNHDHRSIGPLFQATLEQGMIGVEGQDVWLNHYPMRSWNKAFHGSWHLYGHVHGRLQAEDAEQAWRLTRDVGVDACEYRPIGFESLQEYMQPRQVAFAEHRQAIIDGE